MTFEKQFHIFLEFIGRTYTKFGFSLIGDFVASRRSAQVRFWLLLFRERKDTPGPSAPITVEVEPQLEFQVTLAGVATDAI